MATPFSPNPFGTSPASLDTSLARGVLGAFLVLETFAVVAMGGEIAVGTGSMGGVGRWLVSSPGLKFSRKNLIGTLGPVEEMGMFNQASNARFVAEWLTAYVTLIWYAGVGDVVMRPFYDAAVSALTWMYGPMGQTSVAKLPSDGAVIEIISKTGLDRVLTLNLLLVDP